MTLVYKPWMSTMFGYVLGIASGLVGLLAFQHWYHPPSPNPPVPAITIADAKGEPGTPIDIHADTALPTTNDSIVWHVEQHPPQGAIAPYLKQGPTPNDVYLVAPSPGVYHVHGYTVTNGGKGIAFYRNTVTVGTPTPPTPPGPTPPAPMPTPAVLVLYDKAQGTVPPQMLAQDVRVYLDSKLPVGPTPGGQTAHEWRVAVADADMSNEEKIWQDAIKRPHQSLPWIVISNGKTGYEGPLPANAADLLTLLKKYFEVP